MDNHQLPPIRATEPGRGKRKHTLAPARLNDAGKVEVHLLCANARCGCSGWYVVEDLLSMYEGILRGEEKDKEAA